MGSAWVCRTLEHQSPPCKDLQPLHSSWASPALHLQPGPVGLGGESSNPGSHPQPHGVVVCGGGETSSGGLANCSLPTFLLQSFLNPFFFVFKLYLHLDTLLKTLLTWETAETPPAVPADGFYTLFPWEKKVIFGVMLDPKHGSTLRYFTQA